MVPQRELQMHLFKWAFLPMAIGATGLTVAASTIDALRFRVARVAEKAQGHYPEASWSEYLKMLQPGSGIWLGELGQANSLFAVVRNPFRTRADVAAGAELFADNCARCHAADGSGGVGPSLRGRISPRIESDWAAFRTVRYGIPATPMTGLSLDWRDTWRLAGHVRSLVTAGKRATVAPAVPSSRSIGSSTPRRLRRTGSHTPATIGDAASARSAKSRRATRIACASRGCSSRRQSTDAWKPRRSSPTDACM